MSQRNEDWDASKWAMVGALIGGIAALISALVAVWEQSPVVAGSLAGLGVGLLAAWVAVRLTVRPPDHELDRVNAVDRENQLSGEEFAARGALPGRITREVNIEYLMSPTDSNTLILTWDSFLAGCERIKTWVHDYVPPRALYLGINPGGTIIASYVAGKLADHGAKVVSYPTPPWRSSERDFIDPRDVLPASVQDGVILITDTQIRTGHSASMLVSQLEALGFPRERIWFACLAVSGITRTSVGTARVLSQLPGGLVSIPGLFRTETNRFVKERGAEPDFYPHCIAYAAEGFVRSPDGIR